MPRLVLLCLTLALAACASDAPADGSADGDTDFDALGDTVSADAADTLIPEVALTADQAADDALAVGEQAPSFTLPNADGTPTSLAEELAKGPVVLTFYRGAWCPYCNTQLQDYARRYAAIRAAGATLLAVSPQGADGTAAMGDSLVASVGTLPFPVLSDVGNRVSRRYGLVFKVDETTRERYLAVGIDLEAANEDDRWELPVPATYVIDRGATVRAAFVEADYTQRASLDEVVEAIQALGSQ